MAERPEGREAQRRLAFDVTQRVHGEAAAHEAVRVSGALFQREPLADPSLLALVFAATSGPSVTTAVLGGGTASLLAETGLAPSRGEARRLIAGGAITINGQRITDATGAVSDPIDGEWLEVRVGKRNRAVVRVTRE